MLRMSLSIGIVGLPNVGKSTLTDALLDVERNIVTHIAGTTRDSIETLYNKFGHEFVLVDTAGMRRKAKVKEDLEFYSVMRSIRSIEYSDVVIIMLGLAIGAMFVRSMTIYLVEKGTLDAYIYLEHGAHYAIGALAFIMLASGTGVHVPEVVTGLIGVAFIVWAIFASIQYNKRTVQQG